MLQAEVHPLTLEQALQLAAKQNPDITIARLDQERAEAGVVVAGDPFRPKVYLGSGDAYIYGYPNTIEGSAPSLFQLQTNMSIFNRPKTYALLAARETARGSQSGAKAKGEEVAYQAADLFLTVSQLVHQSEIISNELPGLSKLTEAVTAAVDEGSELPLELKSAQVNEQMSKQQLEAANLDLDYYEMMLAVVVGYPATDRVKPVDSDFPLIVTPPSEDAAADIAMSNNQELRQMKSNVLARQMDLRSFKAERLPEVDLVAQYAYFLKENYIQYFPSGKFQANNAELGASVRIPILIGPAAKGYAAQAVIDMQKIRIQMDQTRNRILADTRRSYEQWKKAETILSLAKLRLDYGRERVSVLLAQNSEGRTPLREVEQARIDESNLWIALYDAQTQVARAKFAILRQTGDLLASVNIGANGHHESSLPPGNQKPE
jgi:outer membrane protein TolC